MSSTAFVYDAFEDIGTTVRDRDSKTPVLSGRVVRKTPNAP